MAKAKAFSFFDAALLERCGGPKRGVEGYVVHLVVRGPGLDVATVLPLRPGQGAPAGLLAGELVERSIEPTRAEGLAGLDLLAPFPPLGVAVCEDVLRHRLGRSLLPVLANLVLKL